MVVALLFLFTVLCRFDCWQINAVTATIRMYGSYFYCFTDLAAMVTHCLPLLDTKPSWSRRYKGRFCEIGVVAVWAAHCKLNLKLDWAINIAAFCSKFNWSCEEKTTTTVVQWSWWTPPTTTGGYEMVATTSVNEAGDGWSFHSLWPQFPHVVSREAVGWPLGSMSH